MTDRKKQLMAEIRDYEKLARETDKPRVKTYATQLVEWRRAELRHIVQEEMGAR